MNITASHLPTNAVISPQNVGSSALPKLSVSPSIEITSSPVSGETTPNIKSSVNPTYEKPTVPAENSEAPKNNAGKAAEGTAKPITNTQDDETEKTADNPSSTPQENTGEIYSEAELQQISALKSRDLEVIAHEKAHSAVGGQHAGSPSYSYKTGPDGVKYAVSGEVSIDTSPVSGDPQATIQKAQQIKAAALAPMEPSGQDRKVAAKADQMAAQARGDLLEASGSGEDKSPSARNEGRSSDQLRGVDSGSSESKVQHQMHERSFHINQLYQSSSLASITPTLDIQV